jgi:hypothetical protein
MKLERLSDQINIMRRAESSAFWRSVLCVTKEYATQRVHELIRDFELTEQSYLYLLDEQYKKLNNTINHIEYRERLSEFLESEFRSNIPVIAVQLPLI